MLVPPKPPPPAPFLMVLGRKKPFFWPFSTQLFAGTGQPAPLLPWLGFGFGGAAGDIKAKFLVGFAEEKRPQMGNVP